MTDQPQPKTLTADPPLITRAAADPKPRSMTDPAEFTFLRRVLPSFQVPILDAERWRRTVLQQPVAGLCKTRLITYLQAADWSIETKDPQEATKYAADVEHYQNILDGEYLDFDQLMDLIWQDALDLPVGGNIEIVRYKPNQKPPGLKGDNPLGHVFSLEFMDGATIYPTGDRKLPLVQALPGYDPVYFSPDEIGRILINPRPEWRMRGYGMAPPERIFLAIMMLYYGDQYYAKLLLDTPEAGILYLGDMQQDAAIEWLAGFRELFSGINPMKIPVLYETTKAPEFISFGRPPSEMTYNETSAKYIKLVTAGYNLKPSDVGLEDGQETLAGKIRDDRQARSTGYGVVITKTENFVNRKILPPYLQFQIKTQDEEAIIQMMRARLMAGQAAKALEEAQIATAEELQAQYVMEGLFTVDLSKPKKPEEGGPPPSDGTKADLPNEMDEQAQAENELNKVPADQGGEGDSPGIRNTKGFTQKAMSDGNGTAVYHQTMEAISRELPLIADPGGYQADSAKWLEAKVDFWTGLPSTYEMYNDVRDRFVLSLVDLGYTDEQARATLAKMEYDLVTGTDYEPEILATLFGGFEL